MPSETLYFYTAPNGVATSREFKSRLAAVNYKRLHLEELNELLKTETDKDVLKKTRERIECIKASKIESIRLELAKKPSRKQEAIDRKYSERIQSILESSDISTKEGLAKLQELEAEYNEECQRRNIKQ